MDNDDLERINAENIQREIDRQNVLNMMNDDKHPSHGSTATKIIILVVFVAIFAAIFLLVKSSL